MFTGIVKGTGKIVSVREKEQFRTLTIHFPEDMTDSLETGASVAINGCCLTVTHINGVLISFDVMQETLRITTLDHFGVGDLVNLERAARFGDEVGGHQMSGHILCTARVLEIERTEDNRTLWFSLPEQAAPYILHKGYIAVDGVSLTVGIVEQNRFCVYLIPETLNRTNMGSLKKGDSVNIEADPMTQAVVETTKRLFSSISEKNRA